MSLLRYLAVFESGPQPRYASLEEAALHEPIVSAHRSLGSDPSALALDLANALAATRAELVRLAQEGPAPIVIVRGGDHG